MSEENLMDQLALGWAKILEAEARALEQHAEKYSEGDTSAEYLKGLIQLGSDTVNYMREADFTLESSDRFYENDYVDLVQLQVLYAEDRYFEALEKVREIEGLEVEESNLGLETG